MTTNIENITIADLRTLANKGVLFDRDTAIFSAVENLGFVLNKLRDASAPLRVKDIAKDGEYSAQKYSAILRRLRKAGMVRRIQIGEETITPEVYNWWTGLYEKREPRVVPIMGFELVR